MTTVILHHNFSWELISIADCTQPTKVNDGYCNDETNIPECDFDGGDCCGSCINTDYCTNCTCIGNVIGNGVPNALVSDGFCNDETNNVHCYYDGLDCCRSPVNTELCSNCTCHGELKAFLFIFVSCLCSEDSRGWLINFEIPRFCNFCKKKLSKI